MDEAYAGGLVGFSYNTNVSESGVWKGTVASNKDAGGVLGMYQGAGTLNFFTQDTSLASNSPSYAFLDQLYALDQVTVVANEYAGGIIANLLDYNSDGNTFKTFFTLFAQLFYP